MSAQDYTSYNSNDLAAVLRFVPEHPERSSTNPAMEPINQLDVLATSTWVTKSDVATPAAKQAYLTYLDSLTTVADITGKKCSPINSICGDAKVKPQIVHSSDGALSGMMYLNMPTQAVSYDPSVIVEMVGTVGGKMVHVSGVFWLYDNAYGALNQSDEAKVIAARNAFASNPPADTVALYNRIAAAVQSMKFVKR